MIDSDQLIIYAIILLLQHMKFLFECYEMQLVPKHLVDSKLPCTPFIFQCLKGLLVPSGN